MHVVGSYKIVDSYIVVSCRWIIIILHPIVFWFGINYLFTLLFRTESNFIRLAVTFHYVK